MGVILGVGVAIGFYSFLHQFFSAKFHDVTGRASWIWTQGRIAADKPLVLFAVHEMELPTNREYVKIKVSGDPEYTLWFNGVAIGGSRGSEKSRLDYYDVTPVAADGTNRVVVSLRSARGAGGFIFSLDLSRTQENVVVSDQDWRLFDAWWPGLLERDPPGVRWSRPRELGRPPFGRWDYPLRQEGNEWSLERNVYHPIAAMSLKATLAEARSISGVIVRVPRAVRATAFDFGAVRGRARIESPPGETRVVPVRYMNDLSEIGDDGDVVMLTIANEEQTLVDPVERTFRYLVVYAPVSAVSVVRDR